MALVICVSLRWFLLLTTHDYRFSYLNTFSHLDPILLGALVAILWTNHKGALAKLSLFFLVAAVVLISAIWAFCPLINSNDISITWYMLALALGFAMLLLAALALPFLQKILSLPLVGAFGRLTYGMYVMHVLAMILVETFLASATPMLSPWLRHWLLALPLTISLAIFSWHFFEKPFYALKAKLGVIHSGPG